MEQKIGKVSGQDMKSQTEHYKSYIFDFKDCKLYDDFYLIGSIGWEYRTHENLYSYDCRNQPRNECTFQYTVSGEGALMIGKKIYRMRPGQAFLIEKPGAFKYFLPKDSKHWEFKWIALTLPSIKYWNDITNTYARIVTLPINSSVMTYWDELYRLAANKNINNVFISSAYAYSFVMYLHDTLSRLYAKNKTQNSVQLCLDCIHEHYADTSMDLNFLAEFCGVSPTYLSKLFKELMGETPIQYMLNHRIKKASSLLLLTKCKIEEISKKTGFVDPNYFSRIFKKYMHVSPSEYRATEGAGINSSYDIENMEYKYP